MMDIVPPSYESATARDAWSIIAYYIPSSDLCSVTLVCRRWHELFMPFLWGDPASHFGTDNDAVYVALTRFRRTLKYARLEVRMLTHTLHLPPALSEIYGGPRPEWLKEVLDYLPNLQSLMVSQLPFFDHNAMVSLKKPAKNESPHAAASRTCSVRLLLAEREFNTTSQGLAETLLKFQELVYLNLSYTNPARDRIVLASLSQLERLQVLKLRGIGLKDSEAEFLANAIGTRVRLLDLRNNLLTDMAVRSLLQASFLPPTASPSSHDPRGAFRFHDRMLKSGTLDDQFVKALTQPLTGRSWVDDLAHVGITHLYIADNQLTVEGVASLLASSRLHVLDVGTVDTAGSIGRTQLPTLPSPIEGSSPRLPGAEKLVPALGSIAKENLTYLRAHHAVCTADTPLKQDPLPLNDLLPELPGQVSSDVSRAAELDAAHEIHELAADVNPVFELEDTGVSRSLGSSETLPALVVQQDESSLQIRRGSVFAPEVVEPNEDLREGRQNSVLVASSWNNPSESGNLEALEPVTRSTSPIPADDPRAQKIQELLAKRPMYQSIPRRDGKEAGFPYLHPFHVPHLETLILTDVPSHVPKDSPILEALIRFITACSNEALLATLQAGSDYSLPPGQARAQAEQEKSRSLFALRQIVLEVTPISNLQGPARLGPWKSINQQNGTSRSSTGDRDLENMWSAATADFSFFGEDECGIPDNDPGKYFPMAVLNEKVTLIPEEDAPFSPKRPDQPTRSGFQGVQSRDTSFGSSLGSMDTASRSRSHTMMNKHDGASPPDVGRAEIDLVAELAAFRRAKKLEYETVVRTSRERRSMSVSTSSHLSPSTGSFRSVSPSPSLRTLAAVPAPHLSLAHYVEGHWKGEVKVVRNAAPKGRTGVVDMYGNYFEKGYLYP